MNDCKGQLVFQQGYRTGQKTSEAADIEANAKFKARHTQLVYMAVRNYCNGGTEREITRAGQKHGLKITNKITWRRLSTLRNNGYLRNGEPRKCKVSKRVVLSWWVI